MKILTISEKESSDAEKKTVVKTISEENSQHIYVDAVKFLNSNYELAMDINEDILKMNFEFMELTEEFPIILENEKERHLIITISKA